MSARELRRVELLSRVKGGELKLVEAAACEGASYRQAKHMVKAVPQGARSAPVLFDCLGVSSQSLARDLRPSLSGHHLRGDEIHQAQLHDIDQPAAPCLGCL